MNKNKIIDAWENCDCCKCGEEDCHPNNHRLCGICANQKNKNYYDRRIMNGAYNNDNSKYGWNIDHITPKSKGGTNDSKNLRATHISCNKNRRNN